MLHVGNWNTISDIEPCYLQSGRREVVNMAHSLFPRHFSFPMEIHYTEVGSPRISPTKY
jgi:hypothetical protein